MTYHRIGLNITDRRAKNVVAHPNPIFSINGTTPAVAYTPISVLVISEIFRLL